MTDVLRVELIQARRNLLALRLAARALLGAHEFIDHARVGAGHGALGDGDDAEPPAFARAGADGGGDGVQVVRNLWYQDDIRAPGNSRAERKPARAMAHDLHDDDAVV